MSRVRRRRLFWEAGTGDPVRHAIYVGDPATADFIAQVDAGNVGEHASVDMPELEYYIADLAEGSYQFAVCAVDAAGNFSDPYQHPAWASVPLDLTPPGPPTGGGIDFGDA